MSTEAGSAPGPQLRSKYAHLSLAPLGLVWPVEIVESTVYWDGGSVFLKLSDSDGAAYEILVLTPLDGD